MKIALLTYSTKPRGGVVHTLALAEAIVELGVGVDVWTLGRGGDKTFFRAVDPRVGIRAVPFPDKENEDVGDRIARSIETLKAAFDAVRDNYDIVHAQDCISANAALPCIRTIHHLDNFTTPQLVACHERAIVEPAHRICVSQAVAAEVNKGWGYTPTIIPNGVDAARFEAGATDQPGRRRWRNELDQYVLALGGIEPRKGSMDLLNGYADLVTRRPDLRKIRLVFGGGETLFDYRDYRTEFDIRAKELNLEPVILGTLDHNEIPSLVAEAAALSMVSTKEGFGLAALEALAAGTPVIARDLPVFREVFGDCITYIDEAAGISKALETLVENPSGIEGGRALARSFTWESAARKHLDIYCGRTLSGPARFSV